MSGDQDLAWHLTPCDHEFLQAAAPISNGGAPMGWVVACPVLTAPPDPSDLPSKATRLGFDVQAYTKAVLQVPVVSEQRLRALMALAVRSLRALLVRPGPSEVAASLDVDDALADLARTLADPNVTLLGFASAALAWARRLTGSEHGYLSKIDPVSNTNVRLAQTDMGRGTKARAPRTRSSFPPALDGTYSSLWGHTLNTGEAFFTNTPSQHPAWKGLPEGHEPIRAFLSVPVVDGARMLGQLALANAVGGYAAADLTVIGRLAEIVGFAIVRFDREERLERDAERTRNAQRLAGVGIWEWQIPEERVIWSPVIQEMWGYEPGEFQGTLDDVSARIHPMDLKAWMESVRRCVEGTREHRLEFRVVRPDGSVRWIASRGDAERGRGGRATRMFGTMMDVTEAKRIRSERDRMMLAIEQLNEEIVLTDREGVIHYVNPAFERVTGYSSREAIGNTPRVLKSGAHDAVFYEKMWSTILGGKDWTGQVVNKTKGGKLITEQLTISPIQEDGGVVGFIGVKRDVSAMVRLEDQLRQAQKMEAVGQLAGGIAHDFNNILLAIHGYASFLKEDLAGDIARVADIEEVLKAAARASDLTRQLLAFSRRQVIRLTDQDINELVRGLLRMIRRVLGEHIDLEFLTGYGVATVRVDRTQIQQVLMNLCINARDAMPEGGSLTIETENVRFDSEYVKTHPWAEPGHYVLVSVTDTGSGMDAETVRHVFEPFFTTKPVGSGTGLGLSTAYGIVKQHDGFIMAYSEPEEGSIFKIYLPALERKAVHVSRSPRGAVHGGSETILVAEDDPNVRKLAARILRSVGYTVMLARDGEEAVQLFDQNSESIDCAFFDVIMPHKGGKQAMDEILSRRPGLPHLFTSGYSENAVHTRFVQEPQVQLLGKPYSRDDLLRKIREVLAAGK